MMHNDVKRLGQILLDLGHVSKEQMDLALAYQGLEKDAAVPSGGDAEQAGQSPVVSKIGEFLLKQRCIDEEKLAEGLRLQEQLVKLRQGLDENSPQPRTAMYVAGDKELDDLFPLSMARQYGALPVALIETARERTLYLALSQEKPALVEELQFALGCFVVTILVEKKRIQAQLQRLTAADMIPASKAKGLLANIAEKLVRKRR